MGQVQIICYLYMNKVELFLLNHMEVEFEYCQSTKQGIVLYIFDNLLNENLNCENIN